LKIIVMVEAIEVVAGVRVGSRCSFGGAGEVRVGRRSEVAVTAVGVFSTRVGPGQPHAY
jgi:hypothetical protein